MHTQSEIPAIKLPRPNLININKLRPAPRNARTHSKKQQRAYVLADNRLAEKPGWDKELLALELGELSDFEIDITLTGFDLREVELIMDAGDSLVTENDGPVIATGPAVCRPGDLWQLGRHRLLCGDALDHASYKHLMGRDKARLIVTDPPN